MALNGITDYNLPFLDKKDTGLSLNTLIEGENLNIIFNNTC